MTADRDQHGLTAADITIPLSRGAYDEAYKTFRHHADRAVTCRE
jgi:hypothetical protein